MPGENVERLRAAYEAFNSGDIERILAFTHPEVEVEVPPELSAEPDTYRGHEGIRRYFKSFQDAMDDIRFEPQRYWDGGDRVVVEARLTAKGRQTAIPVEQRFAQVWTIRDGQAIGLHTYASLAEALRVAGLEE